MNNKLKAIIILAIVGILVSIYLTSVHYSENQSLCDLNAQFSCTTVSQSEHAQFFSVPIAVFGLMGYVFILGVSLINSKRNQFKKKLWKVLGSTDILFGFCLLSFFVSAYLTYTEFFIIKAICVLCLLSQLIIIIMLVLSYQHKRSKWK